MAFVDQGIHGAFRATWRKDNPRSLLRTIIAKNPKATEDKIHKLFWQEVENDPELLRACVEYWLDNNYLSLMRDENPVKRRKRADKDAVAVNFEKEKIKERIDGEVYSELLNLIMPNSKKLGECDRKDCLAMGGWLTTVGNQLPKNKTVSEVFTNKQLHTIYRKQ
jgi:hypothetical protein